MRTLYLEGTKRMVLEDEHEIELSYYLTEFKKKGSNDNNLYGIHIEKKDGERIEEENSGCISHSKEVVLQMIHKLMEHIVTPLAMLDIIDDFITEKLCS